MSCEGGSYRRLYLWFCNQQRKRKWRRLKKSDEVLIALLDGNNLDINDMFDNDGLIKNDIRSEVISRINSCREATKEAIPSLVKLPEGMKMTEKRLESLTNTYPQYYLYMFEKWEKGNDCIPSLNT